MNPPFFGRSVNDLRIKFCILQSAYLFTTNENVSENIFFNCWDQLSFLDLGLTGKDRMKHVIHVVRANVSDQK